MGQARNQLVSGGGGGGGGGGGRGGVDPFAGLASGLLGKAADAGEYVGEYLLPGGGLSQQVGRLVTGARDQEAVGGGGGTGSQFVDTTAARNDVMAQLGSLDTQLANMNQTALNEYNALIEAYKAENAANKANYEKQVAQNENTRSGGISQALAAAAQGGRGLRAALAAMGALGGTGQILANRAIASSANKDIGGVNETFDTNATGLTTAWEKTEREQRQRDADAEAALSNARLKNAGNIASQRQNLFRDMAGFWEQAGNKTEASNWIAKRSGQNPIIEAASRAATPAFQRASADFSPAALRSYLAGNQDMAVQTQGGNSGITMNSPLYASTRRREEYA